jgi:two-component system aerobic respiration control sensor histidine kinase ArcB
MENERKSRNLYKKSLNLLEEIIANIPEYIYWKDKNLKYVGCNNNLIRFLGLDHKTDFIGKNDYDFEWSKNQADKFKRDDLEVMSTQMTKITEDAILSKGLGN